MDFRRGFRRICLLCWKNWLMRKRKCCCTVLEAILPLIAVFIFMFVHLVIYLPQKLSAPRGGGGGRGRGRGPGPGSPDLSLDQEAQTQGARTSSIHGRSMWAFTKPYRYPHTASEKDMFISARELLLGASNSKSESENRFDRFDRFDPNPNLPPRGVSTPVLGYAPFTNLTQEIIREALLILGASTAVTEPYHTNAAVEAAARNQFMVDTKEAMSNSASDSTDDRAVAGDTLVAAIVFGDGIRHNGQWASISTQLPAGTTFSYTIRIRQARPRGYSSPRKKYNEETGSFYVNRHSGEIPDIISNYMTSGFSGLQIAVDKAIIKVATRKAVTEKINTAAFPYTSQLSSGHSIGFGLFNFAFPLFLVSGFVVPLIFIIARVSDEKTSGIKELMKMTGLPSWMHWLAWMINSMTLSGISMSGIVLFLFIPLTGEDGGFITMSHLSLWWFVLVVSIMAIATFGFFISNLFENGIVASFLGFLAWIIPYAAVAFVFGLSQHTPTFAIKMATSLLPPVAIHWAIVVLCSLQAAGALNYEQPVDDANMKLSGAYWENFTRPVDDISLGYCILMLLVDTLLYMCLTLYLENVFPGEFGVKKPFYYIFLPPRWLQKKNRVETINTNTDDANLSTELKSGFEAEPMGLIPAVDVQRLTKRFGKKKLAVNQISFKMYEGQITVLLGHNGAGKTTAMSMITGLLAPTSGTATVNGLDMNKDMLEIRDSMGLCPQQNMLFSKLTVAEHLKFFGLLKGLNFQECEVEVQKCLEQLRFEDKKDARSKDLSGGQKRKLCLAMALIGNTKLLILDEPSSGMDPETRRAIWDLLLDIRDGRTILLTTHFMEEADALGDRVIIMAEGEVKCCGTQLYLKKLYGTGYTLKFTTEPDTNKENIVQAVQKHIPKAFIKEQKSPEDFALTIPSENDVNSLFPRMFSELSSRKTELRIVTIGLQVSTMDEVFLKVGELSHPAASATPQTEEKLEPPSRSGSKRTNQPNRRQEGKKKGFKLILQQYWALLLKRIYYTLRRPLLLILQLAFPLCMLVFAFLLFNRVNNEASAPAPLEMKLSDYSSPITYYTQLNKGFGDSYEKVVGSPTTRVKDINTKIWEASQTDFWNYKWKYVVGAEETSDSVTAMFSPSILHSEPLSINLASNALLHKMNPKLNYRIRVTNHPIEFADQKKDSGPDFVELIFFNVAFAIFMKIGLSFFGAIFIVFPLLERLCKAKHLQLMTGVSPLLFWGSSLLWDMIIVCILGGLMVGILAILEIDAVASFSADHGLGVFFLIIFAAGFALISFSYICSLFAGGVTSGFIAVFLLHFLVEQAFGSFGSLIPLLASIENPDLGWSIYIWWIFHVLLSFVSPTYCVSHLFQRFTQLAIQHDHCRKLMTGLPDMSCSVPPGGPREANFEQLCCSNYQDFENSYRAPYLTFLFMQSPLALAGATGGQGGPGRKARKLPMPAVGFDLLLLFLIGMIYNLILFVYESKAFLKLIPTEQKATQPPNQNQVGPGWASPYNTNPQAYQYQQPPNTSTGAGNQVPVPYQYPPQPPYVAQQPPGGQSPYQYPPQYSSVPLPPGGQIPISSVPLVHNPVTEEDVVAETKRVQLLVDEGRMNEDSLVVYKFSKQFQAFSAVADLNFGVHYGECFGLLGVNGAGKTTAFRMITGDEIPTTGTAYSHMYALNKNPLKFLKNIGYCPQFDAFFEVFTGKQVLELYCRLRGVRGSASKEAERWLGLFGLSESKNVQCKNYSGGMKRRLNAAAAMIGDPPVILFDEPTSGVDPIAQHHFWDIIHSLRGSEQAVVLTSHSMGECEALCSRLGIMVNGQFQCFGGVEHLKSKYGEGYTLFIKLTPSIDPERVDRLREEIEVKFKPCVIKDQHLNTIQYQVLNTSMTYGEIFQTTESLKSKFNDAIEDYSVNDTTLEEIFLTFARKQYDERPKIKPKCSCRQCLFCDFECKCEKFN